VIDRDPSKDQDFLGARVGIYLYRSLSRILELDRADFARALAPLRECTQARALQFLAA
jgi:hypothetical protein